MKGLIFIIITFFITLSCYGQHEKKEYSAFINEVVIHRDSFNIKYSQADSIGKDSIINLAREYLINTLIAEIFPYWYGTKWDFNGTTRTPKEGKIACGYFVTNILTDVGFNIPRIKWAQSASEVFIKKLAFENINRFSNKHISVIEEFLKKSGNGIYLVGLDYHVGFVYVNNDQIKFIHSDYYEPEVGVVSEEIDSYSPIKDSSYRVIGKLMSNEMIINWINNIEFK